MSLIGRKVKYKVIDQEASSLVKLTYKDVTGTILDKVRECDYHGGKSYPVVDKCVIQRTNSYDLDIVIMGDLISLVK